ncbi:MAG: hypothetical protein F4X82_03560 [Candidatus Spechtbacteria bacterium SB0662_bin_43]|uniref:Uncharacterized protein n=1 Tax=Candidatus Spechtbacteria bacterium SB0662_bin_43 TaxID=2604897 RepID=A0A845DAX9_9BACT|nr:hypothetical protein [Candidatus Spechtbacteria bacterium SB0662_bin_43]
MSNSITRKEFNQLRDRVEALEDVLSKKSMNKFTKKQSIVEFLLERKPKTTNETVVCSVVYLSHYKKDMKNFESEDVKNILSGVKNSKIKIPVNISDAISQCVNKGWIMLSDNKESGTKKRRYELTQSGNEVVNQMSNEVTNQ